VRPDAIIAGSGLTAPVAWLVGRLLDIPVLVFLYGLDLVVANAWYQALWLPVIRACDGYLVISEYTRSLAVGKGMTAERMRMVHPGVDMPDADDGSFDFRREYGIDDRPIIVSVGRLTRRKGLIEFIQQSLPAIVRANPRAVLVVIGGEPIDALAGNRGGVTDAGREAAKALGLESNVMFLGNVSDAAVRAAYRESRVHVFPVREIPGDIEGFGIVALEAASHGVPTVAFAVGGVPDAVGPGRSGQLIPAGDYAAMSGAIMEYLATPATAAERESCIGFAREFTWDRIGVTLTKSVSEFMKPRAA
jgi:phosphatidylinositol alpha-1,6-mannosyltransferase